MTLRHHLQNPWLGLTDWSFWRSRALLCVIVCSVLSAATIDPTPVKKRGAGPLFRVHHGDKWGFIDRTGKTVIRPQFAAVGDFFEGMAWVEKGEKYGFINEGGIVTVSFQFDNAGDFSEGLAPVLISRKWGYIDRNGRFVIEPQFQGAAEIRDGLGRIEVWDEIQCSRRTYTKNDAPKYVFVIHDTTFNLTSGCLAEHRRFGYLNKKGELTIKPEFFAAENFSEGLAAVRIGESAESKFAFIDKTGKIFIPPQFDGAISFSEGLASVEIGFRAQGGKKVAGEWGFIDHTGRFIIEPQFELVGSFSEGLAPAMIEPGGWGFVDKTGKFVIEPKFSQVLGFSEGVALVWSGDEDGGFYIDKTGDRVVKFELWKQWPFSDGLTVAGEDGKRVYVNRQGKVVARYEIDPRF